jgi:hypothetical protein
MHINLLDTMVGHSHYEIMRPLSLMSTDGAELGEVVQTVNRIKDGDVDQWINEWSGTADRLARAAEVALGKEQVVTARQAFLRASTYYRTAVFYATFDDLRHKRLWEQGRACFHQAIRFMSPLLKSSKFPSVRPVYQDIFSRVVKASAQRCWP